MGRTPGDVTTFKAKKILLILKRRFHVWISLIGSINEFLMLTRGEGDHKNRGINQPIFAQRPKNEPG